MCLSGRLHPAAVVVIAPPPATPRAVQQSTRVFSYSPLVLRWSIIDLRCVLPLSHQSVFIVGPDRGFWTAEASWGRGLTLATNTKAHRGSIVPPAGPENESKAAAESLSACPR
jgi:hypothetical protein